MYNLRYFILIGIPVVGYSIPYRKHSEYQTNRYTHQAI